MRTYRRGTGYSQKPKTNKSKPKIEWKYLEDLKLTSSIVRAIDKVIS